MFNELLTCIVLDKNILLVGMRIIKRVYTQMRAEGSNLDKCSVLDKKSDLEQGFKKDNIEEGI